MYCPLATGQTPSKKLHVPPVHQYLPVCFNFLRAEANSDLPRLFELLTGDAKKLAGNAKGLDAWKADRVGIPKEPTQCKHEFKIVREGVGKAVVRLELEVDEHSLLQKLEFIFVLSREKVEREGVKFDTWRVACAYPSAFSDMFDTALGVGSSK